MAKTLVIYYSRRGQNYVEGEIKELAKGNTEFVVEYIREAVDADVFEIQTVKAYAIDYKQCGKEAYAEYKEIARPLLKQYIDSVAAYDCIVVAGPSWCGTYPMAVLTQLERLDFTGKKVFPVITHEGSGLCNAPKTLEKCCKGATLCDGLAIRGIYAKSSKEEIMNWAINHLLEV